MSVFEKMTAIADLIRSPLKTDEKMGLDRMAELLPEALDVEYNNGHSVGYTEGRDQGYDSGYLKGYDKGHSEGHEEGYDSGHNAGYTEGYDSGHSIGYDSGHSIGYDEGSSEKKAVMYSILDRSVTAVKAEDLEGLTIVADYAFTRCRSLKSVELPEGITYLQLGAFQECSKLSSLILPKSLEVINQNALAGVPLLTELTIYEKIRFVGKGALRPGSVENPATIRFLKTTPVTIGSDSFDTSILKKIVVPQDSKKNYAKATNWCDLTDYIYEENWLSVDTIYTNGSGATFKVEGVGHPYKVGRYLVITADAFSDQAYITDGDIIAACESFTIEGLPGSVYNGDIVLGSYSIDLYEHYTKEEVESLCEKDVQYNITCTPNDPDIDGIYPDRFFFHCYFSDTEVRSPWC